MSQVRSAIVFDLYGTLLDIHVDEASPSVWNEIASGFFCNQKGVTGIDVKKAFHRTLDRFSHQQEEGFLLNLVFPQLLAEFNVDQRVETVQRFADVFRSKTTVYLEKKIYTDSLLQAVRDSKYKLGLISNTEELLTRYDLRVTDLEDAFDQVILSSQIGHKKPDRRIFSEMIARLEIPEFGAVYVGDDFDDDVVGALQSGMNVVYLTAESAQVRSVLEQRYSGAVRCAGFSYAKIRSALGSFGYSLPPVSAIN